MISETLKEYIEEHSKPISSFLSKIRDETYQNLEEPHMICGPQVGAFLQFMIKLLNPKLILDVGTFVGFSALCMAESVGDNGKVISCENDSTRFKIAEKNIAKHPQGSKIELFFGDALDCISKIEDLIDLSFLDAKKQSSTIHYNALVEKTRPGGLIIVDDALWKGEITQQSQAKHVVMHELNKFVLNDSRVENLLMPIRHGLNFIYKKH